MIEHGKHRDVVAVEPVGRTLQRDDAGVHGCQIVESPGGEEHVVAAEHRTASGIGRHDVVAADARGIHPGLACELAQQVGRVRLAEAPHRLGLGLLVEGQVVVGLAVEVDRQLRQPQQRSRRREHRRAVVEHEPTGQTQLAVEP